MVIDEPRARRDPLELDFTGIIEFNLANPTSGGHHQLFITANTNDWQAKELLGGHQCHRLAAALHCLTGWEIIVFERLEHTGWAPVHSAVRLPSSSHHVLDIYGTSTIRDTMARCEAGQHRSVAVENMPGDVLTDIDHLRGNRLWWAAEGPIQLPAVCSHFAKHLVKHRA